MKQGDIKKLQAIQALLSKCKPTGCPPSVVKDASDRLELLASGKKAKKQAPSDFALFVGKEYKRLQAQNPGVPAPGIMKLAAAEWAVLKKGRK